MPDTPQERLCPRCSKPLPQGGQVGLCPACLLMCGLETNTVGYTDQPQAGARWAPPSVEQLGPLFPELDILELIGRGGMGAVYKAREKQLDRLVALKILPPEIGREKAFAQRFAREAQAMAKLNHPNIVTIHRFGKQGEFYFFLMEFVDGLSLRQLLDAGTISPKEALAIVPQICDALQYAHDRGIVHRDIKPENILLNRQGQVKIADFGLAKLVGAAPLPPAESGRRPGEGLPPTGATLGGEKVMGTPRYMAPEQVDRPAEVDHRADIYSLGVVFYQMLTGELPAGRPGETFAPPSRKVLIDVRLDEVVLRALETEPARRYQQASQVKTEVETIVTTPPGRTEEALAEKGPPGVRAEFEWNNRNRSFFWPVVAVRGGKRIINGPGVLLGGSILFLICSLPVNLACAVIRMSPAIRDPLLLLNVMVAFAITFFSLRRSIRRGMKMPLEDLPSLDARHSPAAQPPGDIPPHAQRAWGWEYRSKRTLFGVPLIHVATGVDPATGRYRKATGIIAAGDSARGVIAMGGNAYGVVAFGGMAAGVVALGGFSLGLLSFGGVAIALLLGYGGLVLAPVAIGGVAIGFYSMGGWAYGSHASPATGTDPSGIAFFNRYAPPAIASAAFFIALIAMCALNYAIWVIGKRRGSMTPPPNGPGNAVGQPQPAMPTVQRSWWSRLRKRLLWTAVGIVAVLLVRQFVLDVYRAETDAAAPEIPQGSRVWVNKLARTFEPGDIILYHRDGMNMLGRVVQAGPANGSLMIERRDQAPQTVALADVIGRVVFNTRNTGRPGQPATQPAVPDGIAWGQEVGGVQIGLGVVGYTQEAQISIGEKLGLVICVRNNSDKPAELVFTHTDPKEWKPQVEDGRVGLPGGFVNGSPGEPVFMTIPGKEAPGAAWPWMSLTVPPNRDAVALETVWFQVESPDWNGQASEAVLHLKPGTYAFRYTQAGGIMPAAHAAGGMIKTPVSGELKVTITPPATQPAGVVGTWRVRPDVSVYGGEGTLTFRTDGTVDCHGAKEFHATYELNGRDLILHGGSGDQHFTADVRGDTLILTEKDAPGVYVLDRVPGQATQPAALGGANTGPRVPLNKVIDVTLFGPRSHRKCLLNLETGQTFSWPEGVAEGQEQESPWFSDHGISVYCMTDVAEFRMDNTVGNALRFSVSSAVCGRRMLVTSTTDNKKFETAELSYALSWLGDRQPYHNDWSAEGGWFTDTSKTEDLPRTYVFKLSTGTIGLLQIADVKRDKNAETVFHLRYRILAFGQPQAGSAPTTTPSTQPAVQWGKLTDGVQCRLRPERTVWKAGEKPTFALDLRTSDQAAAFVDANSDAQRWEVEVDGRTYWWTKRTPQDVGWSRTVGPGQEIPSAGSLTLPGAFVAKKGETPLVLPPGKHTVRLSLNVQVGRSPISQVGFRLQTNAVEIEILPAVPTTTATNSATRRTLP